MIGAALAGPVAIVGLLGLVSVLALREFAALPFRPPMNRNVLVASYGLVVVSYVALLAGQSETFITVFPLLAVFLPSVIQVLSGDASHFTRQVGRIAQALLVTTYGLGHLALLTTLPQQANPDVGPVGLFLFVVAVTEINDIAQALVGRRIGRRKLTAISPKKTWEGFAGGLVASTFASVLVGQWMTTMTCAQLIVAGVLMSVAGLFGDLNMSAVKREVGVKDSGTMVPGHGGILDRIDSLTFTTPLFYYFWLGCCQ